uniref:noggin-2-like n=1 Tax=Myxine glutinosa TaxID=7769 RepID=UPI00358F95B1
MARAWGAWPHPRVMLPLLVLLWLLLLRVRPARTQHYLHLKPVPSDKLPVADIIEDPDPALDPSEKDADERVLRRKLGSHFDPDFMAVSRPPLLVDPSPTSVSASWRSKPRFQRPLGAVPPELRRLDLSETALGQQLKLGKRVRRKLLQWLWARTACPVRYTWKELGARFWPRFVKEGTCSRARSCSVPAGMVCRPSGSVSKTLLRWHCQGWERQRFCTWITFQYPVISECKCAC